MKILGIVMIPYMENSGTKISVHESIFDQFDISYQY